MKTRTLDGLSFDELQIEFNKAQAEVNHIQAKWNKLQMKKDLGIILWLIGLSILVIWGMLR